MRDRCITSSDAAVLTGTSPYHTPLQLYEHKLGIKKFDNTGKEWLFQRGHEVEAWAREVYQRETGLTVRPMVVQHGHAACGFMVVSLDGGTEDLSRIVEIKYVGAKSFEEIRSGVIPPHHLDQMQFQLLVTGADSADYMVALAVGGQSVLIEVKRDEEHMTRLEHAAYRFYERMTNKRPPEAVDRDFKLAREPGLKSFLSDIKRVMMLPDRVRSTGIRIQRLTSSAPTEYTRYIVEVRNVNNPERNDSDHVRDRANQEESPESTPGV